MRVYDDRLNAFRQVLAYSSPILRARRVAPFHERSNPVLAALTLCARQALPDVVKLSKAIYRIEPTGSLDEVKRNPGMWGLLPPDFAALHPGYEKNLVSRFAEST